MTKKYRETPMTMNRYEVTPHVVRYEIEYPKDVPVTIMNYRLKHDKVKEPIPTVTFKNYHLKV